MSAFATGSSFPVTFTNGISISPVCNSNSGIILLGSINPIWKMIVSSDPVKLCRWLIVVS